MAGQVLAKVHHRLAGGRGEDLHGCDLADDRGQGQGGRFQRGLGKVEHLHGRLGGLIAQGGQTQIGGLAVVQVVGGDVGGAGRPGRVGGDRGALATFAAQLQLGGQPELVTVDALLHQPGQVPAVPAVAQDDGELVLAGGQGRGEVVGLGEEAAAVLRPAGGELVAADLDAVEVGLVGASGAQVQPGGGQGLGDGEAAHEDGSDVRTLVARGGDRLGGPVSALQEPCLDDGGLRPG